MAMMMLWLWGIIVFMYCASCCASMSTNFTIRQPNDNSNIGAIIHLVLYLDYSDELDHIVTLNIANTDYEDQNILQYRMIGAAFDCTIGEEYVREGKNTLTIRICGSANSCISRTIGIYSQKFISTATAQMISEALFNKREVTTILSIGVSAKLLHNLRINPLRCYIYKSFDVSDSVWNQPFRLLSNINDMINIAAVDYVLFATAALEYLSFEFINILFELTTRRCRIGVLLIDDDQDLTRNLLNLFDFRPLTVDEQVNRYGDIKIDLELNHKVWVLRTDILSLHSQQSLDDESSSSSSRRLMGRTPRFSKVLQSSFTVGRSFMLLENACVIRDPTVHVTDPLVVLFKHPNEPSLIDIPSLVDEDKGFLYTGLRVMEVNMMSVHSVRQEGTDDYDDHHCGNRLGVLSNGNSASLNCEPQALGDMWVARQHWHWLAGGTALSMSVQPGHLVHEIEALVPLLHAAYHARANDSVALCVVRGMSHEMCVHTQAIAGQIRRLVLGKLDSFDAHEGLAHVLGLILGYYESRLSFANFNPMESAAPRLFFANHFFPDASIKVQASQRQGHCFDKLLLLGRTNSHIRFFGSAAVAADFRSHVYDSLGVSEADDRAGRQHWRHHQLRVTIILRADVTAHRRILNLNALLDSLKSSSTFAGTGDKPGLLDLTWLSSHVIMLEALPSFTQQVQLFAASDVLVALHGAPIINGIFMRPGSAVIDIFNSVHMEYVFAPALRESSVKLLHLPVTNHTRQTSDCPSDLYPDWCIAEGAGGEGGDVRVDPASDLRCVKLRLCSVRVDIRRFHELLLESYHHVLSAKWLDMGSQRD